MSQAIILVSTYALRMRSAACAVAGAKLAVSSDRVIAQVSPRPPACHAWTVPLSATDNGRNSTISILPDFATHQFGLPSVIIFAIRSTAALACSVGVFVYRAVMELVACPIMA